MRTLIRILMILIALSEADANLHGQSGYDLFQKALATERADGDLRGAIQLYERMVKQFPGDRPLVASALARMAECYRMLGDAQARRIWEQLVRDYSDQKEATEAKQRLATLEGAKPARPLTIRTVLSTTGRGPDIETVTADGRLGAGGDSSTGDLVIRDMSTGRLTRLLAGSLDPRSMGAGTAVGRYVFWTVFSPDQRQVAFARYGDPENPSQGQLWVIPNEPGSRPRLITKHRDYRNIVPRAWSPDGKSLLAHIERLNDGWQIAWISVADGSVTVLKSFGWIEKPDYFLTLSPDGRHIAYSALVREGSQESHIYLLSSDGSRETVLTRTAGISDSPSWSPDGSHVVFVSDRLGRFDLWAFAVRDGRPAGDPFILKSDVTRIVHLSTTRAGVAFYGRRDVARDRRSLISLVPLGVTGEPQAPSAKIAGANAAWSADGTRLSFARSRAGGVTDIIVSHLHTGEERAFTHRGLQPRKPSWLRDGRELLVLVVNDDTTRSLHRLDTVTGEFNEVLQFSPAVIAAGGGALSEDGQTLYAATRDEAGKPLDRIVALDLTTKMQRELIRIHDRVIAGRVELSPDGNRIAVRTETREGSRTGETAHLLVVDVDGGDPREVHSDMRVAVSGLAWNARGDSLLFAKRQGANRWVVQSVPAAGGSPVDASVVFDAQPNELDASMDGSRIAVSTTETVHEVFAIELPPLSSGKR